MTTKLYGIQKALLYIMILIVFFNNFIYQAYSQPNSSECQTNIPIVQSLEDIYHDYNLIIKCKVVDSKIDINKKKVDYIRINQSIINTPINLNYTINNDGAFFENSTFHKGINLSQIRFNHQVFFETSKITKGTIKESKFQKEVRFTQCHFLDSLVFEGVEFVENVIFENVVFYKKLKFNNVQFKKKVEFINCTLPDTIIFNNINSTTVINLNKNIYDDNKEINIRLSEIDLQKINFQYKYFNLIFPLQYTTDQQYQLYQQLLEQQKTYSYYESKKKLDIEYQTFLHDNSYDSNSPYFLRKWFTKFGYNNQNIIIWTLSLFCAFWLFNSVYFQFINKKVYPLENLYKAYLERKDYYSEILRKKSEEGSVIQVKLYNIFIYIFPKLRVLAYAFIYTFFVFFGLRLDFGELKYPRLLQGFYILIQYILGIYMLLMFINYIVIQP